MMEKDDLLTGFSKYLALEKRLSEATVSAYHYVVRAFLAYLEGKGLELDKTGPNDIADYLAVQSGRGLKASSVFGMGMAIRSFFRFLISKGYAQSDPSENVELPKFHSRLPDPLTEEEVARLLSFPAVRYVQIRDRAILELLYCGLRVSEALSLEKDRIHFEKGYVRICGKGNRERLVPVGRQACQALQAYLSERNRRFPGQLGPVFLTQHGRALSRGAFGYRLKAHARRAGIQRAVYPHLLRHCFASHMVQRGADLRSLQEMLGHRHLSTTAIYLHLDPQRLVEVHRRAHPRA